MAKDKSTPFWRRRKKLNWKLLVALLLLHLVILYLLARAFAPDFTRSVEQEVLSTITVTVTTPDPPEPPEAPPAPDEGAQGDPGKKAVAREVNSPESRLPPPTQAPRASSTGDANRSGANETGDGTGAAGRGDGPGSGREGRGSGNGESVARGPSVKSGRINEARDFPVPEGGRATRFGKSVTVVFTVTTDGRAKNCSVRQSSVDPQTTGLVCGLVTQKIRFNPAVTTSGRPVEARYGYRVDFRAR